MAEDGCAGANGSYGGASTGVKEMKVESSGLGRNHSESARFDSM